MDNDLTQTLKYLRLPGLLAHWDQYLDLARQQRFSHVRLLRHVLDEEFKIRTANAHRLRLRRARIPEMFHMENYPFNRQPKLDRKRILSMTRSTS